VVEGKKQQRLDWLDWLEPGQVRGELLREAIGWEEGTGEGGGGDGQWLRNMAVWGYPKGWTGLRDPRYEVMKRIEGEVENDEDDEDEDVFVIFGDAGEEEKITFTTPLLDFTPPPQPKVHRWASYPTTYFSSALLPIYTGSLG